jgi:RNA methyltransferase, TrmH family
MLLRDRSGRLKAGCFPVEGIRLVGEAFRSAAPILRLLADDEGMPALADLLRSYHGPEPTWVSSAILEKLSDTKSPQGVIAIVRLPDAKLPDSVFSIDKPHGDGLRDDGTRASGMPSSSIRRILALEHVQDPGNVGTMIRTADACGFGAVILSADSADPWQPKALRSSMGSVWHLSVTVSDDLPGIVDAARNAGIATLAAHPRSAASSWDTPLADHVLLVIGNEAVGISGGMLERVDGTVMIPMDGRAESLNAAAAASMLMYESLRQRRMGTGT